MAAVPWFERENPVGPYYCGPRPHPDHPGCPERAIATALAAERRAGRVEALREAADEWDVTWNRGHDNSVHPFSHLLRDRADREAGADQ